MRLPGTSWLLAGLRLIRMPLILVVLYLALHPVMTALSQRQGFGSPDGTGLDYLAVSVALLTLRMALLVVVPAVLTYRVVAYAVTHILRRTDSKPRPTTWLDRTSARQARRLASGPERPKILHTGCDSTEGSSDL
ncbi:hypothetical protein [Nocardia sp. bgisy134]|uniref:hypothetical protein n=1 Tax=Nocardia sp. bgisy134 TaxID=3413789 RepID=UPI003D713718